MSLDVAFNALSSAGPGRGAPFDDAYRVAASFDALVRELRGHAPRLALHAYGGLWGCHLAPGWPVPRWPGRRASPRTSVSTFLYGISDPM